MIEIVSKLVLDRHDEAFWDMLDKMVEESCIIIDRPKGTCHPRYNHFIYKVDYGYLQNTTSMDGGGIDVWRGTKGTDTVDGIICTIDILKKDSEIKLLIACTEDEMETVYETHNESEYMKGIFIAR